jgi:uncharacterized Fe-S cluster-containing radical SAM superfamily enzyme
MKVVAIIMNQSINMPLKIDRAVIEINGGCNYTCGMCPQTEGRGKDWLKKMSVPEFERIVAECAEHGLRLVNLEGSGEPTLNSNLPEYIAIVKKYGAQAVAFSNGFKMSGAFMQECVDAGLGFFRFSVIGYDRSQYAKWMAADNFNTIVDNAKAMKDYVDSTSSDCTVASYHLITDPTKQDYEIDQYRKKGYKIVGYGAAAKGNTLLNFAEVDLDIIVDDNPLKQNRVSPGRDIPIVSMDYVTMNFGRSDKVLFVPLAWNFFKEIKNRIKNVRDVDTDRFLRYFPEVEVGV